MLTIRYFVNALELSKYIITVCNKLGNPISNLKLQHILYYIQCYCVKKIKSKIFYDDIEAWTFGPSISNVYYYFCNFGAMPIDITFDTNEYNNVLKLDKELKEIIDFIIKEKCKETDWDLIKNIHKENGDWVYTFKDGEGHRKVINFEKYFKNKKNEKDA